MKKRYSKLNLFSADGRIGRMPYALFSIIVPLIVFWMLSALAGLLAKLGSIGEMVGYAMFLVAIIATLASLIVLTIQRCHDFNMSGWLSALLVILPPMLILFWLMPGTNGINSYGEPPVRLNKKFMWIAAALAALLALATAFAFYQYY